MNSKKVNNRIIAHLDLDAFFAAVEERDHPWLKGKPLVVGADPNGGRGRGVVATASYAARAYGIRSAMPISKAWQLSEAARRAGKEPATFLLGNHRRYSEVSGVVMILIGNRVSNQLGNLVSKLATEQAGIDEMYCDLSFTGSFENAEALIREIKKEIRGKERLTISAGIGPNKLIAKIASERQKPDGLTLVRPENVQDFLDPLPARVIPGIGPKTDAELEKMYIRTILDLRALSREELIEQFGKWGSDLYRKARGEDDSIVEESDEIKSVGEQETFEIDTLELAFVCERLNALCSDVFRRFRRDGFKTFRTVVVTVRFADFQTQSRAHTLKAPAATGSVLRFEALKSLLPFFDKRENPESKKIRLIGVRVERLSKRMNDRSKF
ncbi:MAG: DNA polymerase IV [Candidatus Niyogibacteria bacterium]|nr:DNA polymerase IV [Candidatus Niyogibacteria bacterium]